MSKTKVKVIADQQARQQALDIHTSCIVQAPAGSGKTELLSQRYLHLLAHCQQPEAVLAITFTRKAASEMRARIIGALESALAAPPEETHKRQTWTLAKAVLQQDQHFGWQILTSPARLKIVTIDSLNASLARQMPLLSKMGSMSSPQENCEPLYLEAARRTLAELDSDTYGAELQTLMLHLGNQIERVQSLLMDMLSRRDQWLRHLLNHSADDNHRSKLEQGFYQLIKEHLTSLQDLLPAGFVDAAADLLAYAAETVDDKQTAIKAWHNRAGTHLSNDPAQLLLWQGLASLLLTESGSLRKSVTKNLGFPAPSTIKDAQEKARASDRKAALMALIEEINDEETADLLHKLRQMPSLAYSDEQWHLLNAFTRVLILAAANLQIVFSEQGKVDFAQISLAALQALENEERPTELAMIMDYQLQHILVDEFQDTSHSQFRLLEQLTSGWQPDDGRTLFLVGDPMQSIYRFREAEVGLYLKARNRGIGDIQLKALYLSVNFRSQQGVVDWVNDNLKTAFAQKENPASGAVSYSPSVPFNDLLDGKAVTLHPLIEQDMQAEAESVCEIISRAQQQDKNTRIAILVRSRSHLAEIIPALQQRRINFQAVDLDPLAELPAIKDIYCLTRAMLHFADRLHWLAILRAAWCGLCLDDLETVANGPSREIWQNCLDALDNGKLSKDGHQRLQGFVSRLQPVLHNRGRLSLKNWLAKSWRLLGGESIYSSSNDHLAIQRYLLVLDSHQRGGAIESFAEFDQVLEKLFAAPDRNAEGNLQIMTIHKSKGLEFDIVILPGLGKRGRPDERGLLEWLERPNSLGQVDLLLSPVKASENDTDDDISQSLKAINRDKAGHELTRLLYVALTRAKQSIHLLGHADIDAKGQLKVSNNSLLAILWPALKADYEAIAAQQSDCSTQALNHAAQASVSPLIKRLPDDWQLDEMSPLAVTLAEQIEADPDSLNIDYDWASETARHVGIVTHSWLEQIAATAQNQAKSFHPETARTIIRNQLQEYGCHYAEIATATEKVIQAIANTVADTHGQWLMQAHQQAENELALTCYKNNEFVQYIIDRTFIDENGTRWIVDYKTGSHEGGDLQTFLDNEKSRYQSQLENYASLMNSMDPRPVKLALYFPLMRQMLTWDYQPTAH